MRKTIFSALPLVLLALSQMASAVTLELVAHNQRSSSGVLSTLKWATCAPTGAANPCLSTNPATTGGAWSIANATGSTATWDWNSATGVLTSSGLFQTTSFVNSNANGSPVISDKVVDLVIDTTNDTTTATSYNCVEGTFLASVGAHGCANVGVGDDFLYDGSVAYNVGGDANCVQRTLGGDDVDTGNPRSLTNTAGGGGCDPGDGAFNLWTVVEDNTATGGQLIISNNVPIADAGTNYLTFQAVPDATDDSVASVLQGVPASIEVLANDTLFTDPVTVAVTTPPGKGTAVVQGSPGNQADIRIEYTANADALGPDSFVYAVTDADGTTQDSATVSIAAILAFGANDDTGQTTRNVGPIGIDVGANDIGFTEPVTITIVAAPDQGGTATPPAGAVALAEAIISYTPAATAQGTATYEEAFTYQISDAGSLVRSATVRVTVSNTVPVANDTTLDLSTAGAEPDSVSGSFNAGTLAGNSLGNGGTVAAANGAKGLTSINGSTVTYTPGASFFQGDDEFTYTITDTDPGDPETDTGTVAVTIPDLSPALANRSITITGGTEGTAALTITPGNGSFAQHTLAVTTQAANGTCVLSGTSVTYTLTDPAFTGSDSCVITIIDEDGNGDSATATISITVNAAPGGGGGRGLLPGGSSAMDAWVLALLGAGLGLRRRLTRGTRR